MKIRRATMAVVAAGAGLCDPAAVRRLVEDGPDAVAWLLGRRLRLLDDCDVVSAHVFPFSPRRPAAGARPRPAKTSGSGCPVGPRASRLTAWPSSRFVKRWRASR